MAGLIVYDSSRQESRQTALVALHKYPSYTLKDFVGLSMSDIDTYIGTLTNATQDKIICCVNSTRVEEVLGTAVVTLTAGAANEIGYINIENAGGDILMQAAYTTAAGTDEDDAVLAITAIYDGTAFHGFSAANVLGVVTITAPTGSGATANTYVCTGDADTGGTLAIAITTDFAATATGVTAVGVLGDISEEDFIDFEAKIFDAPLASGTSTAGAATTITLAAGSSAVDDYYNGKTIMLTANTGANQVRTITDYDGTTLVATVDYAWGTNPDATTDYVISEDLYAFGRNIATVSPPKKAWLTLTGYTFNIPEVLAWTSDDIQGKLLILNATTADSVATGTLTDTGAFTADAFTKGVDGGDYYVAIISGTLGVGQVAKIASNTADVLTLDENWLVTPTGTVVYQVLRGKDKALWNYYLPYGLDLNFDFSGNTTPGNLLTDFGKLLDKYDGVASAHRNLYTDLEFLGDVAADGKIIFDAVAAGIVS